MIRSTPCSGLLGSNSGRGTTFCTENQGVGTGQKNQILKIHTSILTLKIIKAVDYDNADFKP